MRLHALSARGKRRYASEPASQLVGPRKLRVSPSILQSISVGDPCRCCCWIGNYDVDDDHPHPGRQSINTYVCTDCRYTESSSSTAKESVLYIRHSINTLTLLFSPRPKRKIASRLPSLTHLFPQLNNSATNALPRNATKRASLYRPSNVRREKIIFHARLNLPDY